MIIIKNLSTDENMKQGSDRFLTHGAPRRFWTKEAKPRRSGPRKLGPKSKKTKEAFFTLFLNVFLFVFFQSKVIMF
jgi:hypothetical protein